MSSIKGNLLLPIATQVSVCMYGRTDNGHHGITIAQHEHYVLR